VSGSSRFPLQQLSILLSEPMLTTPLKQVKFFLKVIRTSYGSPKSFKCFQFATFLITYLLFTVGQLSPIDLLFPYVFCRSPFSFFILIPLYLLCFLKFCQCIFKTVNTIKESNVVFEHLLFKYIGIVLVQNLIAVVVEGK